MREKSTGGDDHHTGEELIHGWETGANGERKVIKKKKKKEREGEEPQKNKQSEKYKDEEWARGESVWRSK